MPLAVGVGADTEAEPGAVDVEQAAGQADVVAGIDRAAEVDVPAEAVDHVVDSPAEVDAPAGVVDHVVGTGRAEVELVGPGGLPELRLAACMPGKCGSTTVDIVLHNSMDYCKLDIDSFLFLRPSNKGKQ